MTEHGRAPRDGGAPPCSKGQAARRAAAENGEASTGVRLPHPDIASRLPREVQREEVWAPLTGGPPRSRIPLSLPCRAWSVSCAPASGHHAWGLVEHPRGRGFGG
eukprot:CAMPEP_0173469750 /NCGR_PEP_ID=MMETSP1357-20121228/77524_1 /TAXON_ID=77926 /ORGANISM="Hemiselmis rufescens, Strain PCC563" /LENGTH=104 /DNA_ID=CAMNT_0014438001 /DNA_START=591 /DNA_END=905 /DNA_ORIENTATION=-